ncbi:MAG: prepilin-type N-terminal cleavage/methylation domain-containing protein [Candidatus Gracilibacteria bacterium]|nr:prepilin-type N-terminal cleavage/methylation domain-containing protein [Candidatus Gracilibacteria bacterium]
MKVSKQGFTLVELIVVATILVILAVIGFASYSDSIPDARDAERKSAITQLKSSLMRYKQERAVYPLATSATGVTLSGTTVVYHGDFDNTIRMSNLDKLLIDPKTKTHYKYSITTNKQEFQIAASLENGGQTKAYLDGQYNTVSVNRLPTIMFAKNGPFEIVNYPDVFIFHNGSHNIPYEFTKPYDPYSSDISLTALLEDPQIEFWPNSDYRSCQEIYDAGKQIGEGEYQYLTGNTIENITCSF